MKNLAGNPDCDSFIGQELFRAGIRAMRGKRANAEVPASITGQLGTFTFHRAWCYWVVSGPMPLAVAQELYADPVGKTDVRVVGHCGCPPPEDPWVEWLMSDGRRVWPKKEEAACRDYATRGLLAGSPDDCVFSDEPAAIGAQGFVMSYHIDTEVGLRLFADTVKKHGLA